MIEVSCRLNNCPPIPLKLEAPSSAEFDFKLLPQAKRGCFRVVDITKESEQAGGSLQQIFIVDVFLDADLRQGVPHIKADMMYRAALVTPAEVPQKVLPLVGEVNCVTPAISCHDTAHLQWWLSYVRPSEKVFLCLYEIPAPPAWKSGGLIFERVSEQLVNKWRRDFMSEIKRRIDANEIHQNIALDDTNMMSIMVAYGEFLRGTVDADVTNTARSVGKIALLD